MVNKPKRLTGLGQKARNQVRYCLITRRERSTAGVESEPKSSTRDCCGTWKSCTLARSHGQTLPQGGSGAAASRGPKKPMLACNALDMPTSVWFETAETTRKPPHTRKANDGQRPLADASWSSSSMESHVHGPSSVLPSGAPHVMRRVAGRPHRAWPYEDLSRMKGNFHVRFLEGGGLVTARPYSLESCEGVPAGFGRLCPGRVSLEEFGLRGVPPHNFLANSAAEGLY
jgi:hypothetical protein